MIEETINTVTKELCRLYSDLQINTSIIERHLMKNDNIRQLMSSTGNKELLEIRNQLVNLFERKFNQIEEANKAVLNKMTVRSTEDSSSNKNNSNEFRLDSTLYFSTAITKQLIEKINLKCEADYQRWIKSLIKESSDEKNTDTLLDRLLVRIVSHDKLWEQDVDYEILYQVILNLLQQYNLTGPHEKLIEDTLKKQQKIKTAPLPALDKKIEALKMRTKTNNPHLITDVEQYCKIIKQKSRQGIAAQIIGNSISCKTRTSEIRAEIHYKYKELQTKIKHRDSESTRRAANVAKTALIIVTAGLAALVCGISSLVRHGVFIIGIGYRAPVSDLMAEQIHETAHNLICCS